MAINYRFPNMTMPIEGRKTSVLLLLLLLMMILMKRPVSTYVLITYKPLLIVAVRYCSIAELAPLLDEDEVCSLTRHCFEKRSAKQHRPEGSKP